LIRSRADLRDTRGHDTEGRNTDGFGPITDGVTALTEQTRETTVSRATKFRTRSSPWSAKARRPIGADGMWTETLRRPDP
jgi:hypothetical protein